MSRYQRYQSRRPYEVTDELAARASALSMTDNLTEIRDQGYAIIRDAAPMEVTDRIRAAILRLAEETEGDRRGRAAALLLGRDPVFESAVLNPKVLLMVEYLCGQGALLSQLIGSVRPQGGPPLQLHSDQNWVPAPFPEHNQLLTFCWVCDDFTREGGATKVVPGSHGMRRHPTEEEEGREAGAVPIECPKGSVAVWDGSVWHGNYARTLPGERVVLHMTYGRLALRPIEDYSALDAEVLRRNPPELARLVGRDDFFGTTTATSGGTDMEKFERTAARSKQ